MPNDQIRTRKLQPKYCRRLGGDSVVPSLHLAGVWLEKRGFQVGDIVEIIERDGLLIIQSLRDESAELRAARQELRDIKQGIKALSANGQEELNV